MRAQVKMMVWMVNQACQVIGQNWRDEQVRLAAWGKLRSAA